MFQSVFRLLGVAALALGISTSAQATVISFTGGTGLGTSFLYEEGGFRIETIGGPAFFGDYYGTGNNVIHSHWQSGCCGTVSKILVTKTDGSAFDLNYFILTSNTHTGGSAADGNEKTFIHASVDGIADSYSQLLPPEDWGFPATQIFLGDQFDQIKAFWFTQESGVDCFGMDSFYIDEPAPVPEPASFAITGLALLGLAFTRRRKVR